MTEHTYGDLEQFSFCSLGIAVVNDRGVALINLPGTFQLKRRNKEGDYLIFYTTTKRLKWGGGQSVAHYLEFKVTEEEMVYALDRQHVARYGHDRLLKQERPGKRKRKRA